jgi:hypothetical protein
MTASDEVDEREGREPSNKPSDASLSISVLSTEYVRDVVLASLGDVGRTIAISSPEVSRTERDVLLSATGSESTSISS